jgi:hypothetical protein
VQVVNYLPIAIGLDFRWPGYFSKICHDKHLPMCLKEIPCSGLYTLPETKAGFPDSYVKVARGNKDVGRFREMHKNTNATNPGREWIERGVIIV